MENKNPFTIATALEISRTKYNKKGISSVLTKSNNLTKAHLIN